MIDRKFSEMNRRRCEAPVGFNHALGDWEPSMWVLAMCGEAGEAANVAKKIRRAQDGLGQFNRGQTVDELTAHLVKEICDVLTYADLALQALGVEPGKAIRERFDEVSRRHGMPFRFEASGGGEP